VARVELKAIGKTYPDGTKAVRDISLTVEDGQLLVLVGPSGCGKTTVLRMVAGLEDITDGRVTVGDRVVNDLSEAERDIAMVFQTYALYPHLTVRQNIAFPLCLARVSKGERKRRVDDVAQVLGLTKHLDQKPGQLSGGQRQRVAMGRAIVREPQVFLMDEPLSNLDAKLRVKMRSELSEMQQRLKVTTLYVTHDQAEAMTLGDRVAVLRDGELQQQGPPDEIYERPANVFVAGFLGNPAMNLLSGRIEVREGFGALLLGPHRIRISESEMARHPALPATGDVDVVAGVRPETLWLAEPAGDEDRSLRGEVMLRESLGSDVYVHVKLAGVPGLPPEVRRLAMEAEDVIDAEESLLGDESVIVARLAPTAATDRGDTVALRIEDGALLFFDAARGVTLARGGNAGGRA